VQGTAQHVHAEGRAAERDDRIGSGGETLGAGKRHRCTRPPRERARRDRHYRHEQQEGQNLHQGRPPYPVIQVWRHLGDSTHACVPACLRACVPACLRAWRPCCRRLRGCARGRYSDVLIAVGIAYFVVKAGSGRARRVGLTSLQGLEDTTSDLGAGNEQVGQVRIGLVVTQRRSVQSRDV
jgi:hypothetical protein